MLSAILSDTLILKSPTTTEMDKIAVEELAKICEENYEEYGLAMLKAGSSVEGMEVEDIIFQDFKSFKVGSESLGIGQVITMDFDNIKENIDKFIEKLNEMVKGEYSTVVLFITDIIKNGSCVLYNDAAYDTVKDSFGIKELEQGTFIPGMVSRKKQMLPNLMETMERNS